MAEVDARPNPVRSGASVTINASFKESQPEGSDPPDGPGETRLTVQGCATCGFGSPQSFASIDRSSGIARIGSTGKASSPAATSEEILRCTAIIHGPEGSEVDRTALLSTSEGDCMGIWNANVSPGLYRVGLLVMAGSISEAFHDLLEIEVTD